MGLEVVKYHEKKSEGGFLIEKSIVCAIGGKYFKIVYMGEKLISFERIAIKKGALDNMGQIKKANIALVHSFIIEGMNSLITKAKKQDYRNANDHIGITESLNDEKKDKLIQKLEQQRRGMLIAMRPKLTKKKFE